MSIIIAVSNHKGGVGKTTSTVNIGAALVRKGYKVLLVDLDPQANLTQSLDAKQSAFTIYDYIKGSDNVIPVQIKPNLFMIPSSLDLSAAEVEISSEPGREYILKDILSKVEKSFDYILIDCPPSLSILTINAFTASKIVIIPMQAEYLPLRGLAKLTEVINKIKTRLNPQLEIRCVFLTKFDSRKILNRDVAESIKNFFGEKLLKNHISTSIALAEAPSQGKDIFMYNNTSKPAQEYAELTDEILEKVQ
jgi:chromosome partitioning protein